MLARGRVKSSTYMSFSSCTSHDIQDQRERQCRCLSITPYYMMDGAVNRARNDAKSLVPETRKLVGIMIVGNVLFDGTELR